MAQQRITIDNSSLNRLMAGFRGFEREIPKAFVAAQNRTLAQVYTKAAKVATSEYRIKTGEVKAVMKKTNATFSKSAMIKIRSRRLTLGRFLSPSSVPKSKNIKAKVMKSGRMKRVGGEPKPFVLELNGNRQVMRRKTSKRYPLEVMRTLTPTQMVMKQENASDIQAFATEVLSRRIDHEIQFRLARIQRRSGQ